MNQGVGWGGFWVGSSLMVDQPPTLSYPTALPSTGDALLNPAVGEAFRSFAAPLNNLANDLWISFQEETVAAAGGAFVDLLPVSSFPDIQVNKAVGGSITLNGIAAGASGGVGQVDFFVLQLSQFTGTTTVNLFLDPGPGALFGPPTASLTVASPFMLSQFYYRSDPGQLLDEIRAGTTLPDVAAAAIGAPEPRTMLSLLAGFAGLLAVGRRRNFRAVGTLLMSRSATRGAVRKADSSMTPS